MLRIEKIKFLLAAKFVKERVDFTPTIVSFGD